MPYEMESVVGQEPNEYPVGFKCDIEAYHILFQCIEKEDMSEWNSWREKNKNSEIYLQGIYLKNKKISDANFSKIHFQKAIFDGVYFNKVIFEYAHCEEVKFESACCIEVNFRKAHCERAKFNDAHCIGVNFEKAHCEGAIFQKAHCKNALFVSAHCEEAEFEGAHCEGASFREAYCERAVFENAHCEKANFEKAHCKGAFFMGAHCEEARFVGACFEEVDFSVAHCEGVNYGKANCGGARFIHTHCEGGNFEGTDCENVCFNGAYLSQVSFNNANIINTQFWNVKLSSDTTLTNCTVNDGTLFINSSLASIIIEPGTRAKLEQNARRYAWERWYPEHVFVRWPVLFFWKLSDYGYSTSRIFLGFLLSILLFSSIYTACPGMLNMESYLPGEPWYGRLFRMGAFATATMVTLGFSNINVHVAISPMSYWGTFVVSVNLLVGYFMLAVLVTRLAVLFQTLGPGLVVKKPSKPCAPKPREE